MGCANSSDHPKNVSGDFKYNLLSSKTLECVPVDLIKFKKKYDPEIIKHSKLHHVWVIGGDKDKTLELAKLISDKQGYLLLSEETLVQMEAESGSERGEIIDQILKDKASVSPVIVLDLVAEAILSKLDGIKGVVFHGIPRDKEEAIRLQRLVGPATLVVYCELKGEALKTALTEEGDDVALIKSKVEIFQKSVIQLSKHKNSIKIDGEADLSSSLDVCMQKLSEVTVN